MGSDTDFPGGVVDAMGNPHFIPTGHPGAGIMQGRGFYKGPRRAPVTLEPAYLSSAEFQQAEHEVFASGAGSHVLPGWSGKRARRDKGILISEPSITQDDVESTVRDDTQYGMSTTESSRSIERVLRDKGHNIGPDERVEADPFGTVSKRGVVARSGNEDPNTVADDFSAVGMGADPVAAAPTPGVNWGATALIVALGVGLVLLAKSR